jgi:hypothetical protein
LVWHTANRCLCCAFLLWHTLRFFPYICLPKPQIQFSLETNSPHFEIFSTLYIQQVILHGKVWYFLKLFVNFNVSSEITKFSLMYKSLLWGFFCSALHGKHILLHYGSSISRSGSPDTSTFGIKESRSSPNQTQP